MLGRVVVLGFVAVEIWVVLDPGVMGGVTADAVETDQHCLRDGKRRHTHDGASLCVEIY